MSVELAAAQLMEAIVRVNNGDHLINDGLHGVVIFIPDDDDRAVTALPDVGAMDRCDDLLYGLIAQDNQCRV